MARIGSAAGRRSWSAMRSKAGAPVHPVGDAFLWSDGGKK
jgi:hypothetical protein